ncbi:hypothetical protein AJ79_09110 [Helicocarpus griseus UAMH5409]|uniref:Phosphotransferase n=1 Tax=Helicocarpus griseus UAMH5409 TaxID=1447875 RepID=A0A2B7WM56_9EURO|nr:hypothetical protein AJ79_09110 [Helicocarpus griseus UAMH5409]
MSINLETATDSLRDLFHIGTEKLKAITEHFTKELTKAGLSIEGGNIPMNPTFLVDTPKGDERGSYLTLDMGGSHIRVCQVVLEGKRHARVSARQYDLPEGLKSSTAEELWDHMASCVAEFIEHEQPKENRKDKQLLAFTFSFPVTQSAVNRGVLQRWTKGFDVSGAEGYDVVEQFEAALKRQGLSNVEVAILINDTTGTMVSSMYREPDTCIGAIFGTGCNAAYMEDCGNIPKLREPQFKPGVLMAINCEYGAFDNEHLVLPRTKYDVTVDKESPRPGQQSYEKMTSGLYLGEIFRLVLQDLKSQDLIFRGKEVPMLDKSQTIDCIMLAKIGMTNHFDKREVLEHLLKIPLNEEEVRLCRDLARMIDMRAARLCACGLAAIYKKRGLSSCVVGIDGSVLLNNPELKDNVLQALGEILGYPVDKLPLRLNMVKDGSSEGAAIAAAVTGKGAGKI